MTIVRSQIEQQLAERWPNILRKDIDRIVNIILSEIVESLKRQERVQLRGFGTMTPIISKARLARNPKTNEQIEIESKIKIKYKMGKDMFRRLNK